MTFFRDNVEEYFVTILLIYQGIEMKRKIVIVVYFLFLLGEIFPQIKIFRNLRVEDGLVQSTVRAISQDKDGFIYFGTESGLSRWDGINFTNYQYNDGLSDFGILDLAALSDGSTLITTRTGIDIFTKGQLHKLVKNIPDKYILTSAIVNRDIWLGTSKGVYVIKDDSLHNLFPDEVISNSPVSKIYAGPHSVFMVVKSNQVYKFSKGRMEKFSDNSFFADKKINTLYESSDGSVYFGTNSGVIIFTKNQISLINESNGLSANMITDIEEGDDGTIYIATSGGGLNRLKNGTVEVISINNGLPDNHINCLFKGNDRTIYIGTSASGVFIYRDQHFQTYNETVGLHNNFIMSIIEDEKGTMYFGTMSEGLSIFENGKFRKLDENGGLKYNSVINSVKGNNGLVYFSNTYSINIYNPTLKKIIKSLEVKKDIPYWIGTIYENSDGILLIGTTEGLFEYSEGKINESKIKIKNSVSRILQVGAKQYYFGTSGEGVIKYNNGTITAYNEEKGLVNDKVISLFRADNGEIYVGTTAGLSIIRGDEIENLTTKQGLSDNTIYGIISDNEGRIYLTTNRGINVLTRINGQLTIRIIRSVDGLASDELNGNAVWKDKEGKLWFGTVRGVTCYDPLKDTPHKNPPHIHITEATVVDKNIDVTKKSKLVLKFDENYIRFNFIGINISSPKSVVYKYRMTGLDESWIETAQNSVQYANLNDGSYFFEVKAKNEWGYWSEPVKLSFVINPPYWETWWFISGILVFILLIVTYILTYRFRQLLAIERLRTQIAADLHDNIGSSLTEISILGEVLNKNITIPNQFMSDGLTKISDISRGLIDKMSDIVWLVNPKRDSIYDLILRLKDSYSELLSHQGISFKAHNLKSLENISLDMTYRQNLYLIFKEGINNSIKHSSCNEINIEANVKGKSLEVILKDNGIGFSEKLKEGNGLDNMKYRAELIGGKLMVQSVEGEGTKIQFVGDIG